MVRQCQWGDRRHLRLEFQEGGRIQPADGMVKRPEQMRVIDGYRVRLRLPADHATTGGASKRRCRTALFVEVRARFSGLPRLREAARRTLWGPARRDQF